jgi:hypothetical protein
MYASLLYDDIAYSVAPSGRAENNDGERNVAFDPYSYAPTNFEKHFGSAH